MEETKYREIAVPAEDRRLLVLSYFILRDADQTPPRYGVKVTERHSGGAARAEDLTTDPSRVRDLADKLVRNAVTPTGLPDVIADWL